MRVLGDDSISVLIAGLGTPDASERRSAAEKLGRSGDERALEALVALALNDEGPAGDAAVMAIGRIGGGAGLAVLQAMMPGYREEQAQTQRVGIRRASTERPDRFAALGALVSDRDPIVRRAACSACAQLDDPRALGLLISAVHDEVAAVRCAAIAALGTTGGVVAVESLIAALDHEEEDTVRQAILDALAASGHERARSVLGEE